MARNADNDKTRPRLLIGTDYEIERKLENARAIFAETGAELARAAGIEALLRQYEDAVRDNWRAMERHGVVAECTDCAVNDGGSCCGRGIEDRFDAALIIINLLLGSPLPEARRYVDGCWFLGDRGCLIRARHVICINYMCKRLYSALEPAGVHAVQEAMGREADLLFMLEEKIKGFLRSRGY